MGADPRRESNEPESDEECEEISAAQETVETSVTEPAAEATRSNKGDAGHNEDVRSSEDEDEDDDDDSGEDDADGDDKKSTRDGHKLEGMTKQEWKAQVKAEKAEKRKEKVPKALKKKFRKQAAKGR